MVEVGGGEGVRVRMQIKYSFIRPRVHFEAERKDGRSLEFLPYNLRGRDCSS